MVFVRLLRWYGTVPQPLRWALGGGTILGVLGAVYGIAEAIHDYPLSSWLAVTMYVALLGGFAGFVVGLFVGLFDRRGRSTVDRK